MVELKTRHFGCWAGALVLLMAASACSTLENLDGLEYSGADESNNDVNNDANNDANNDDNNAPVCNPRCDNDERCVDGQCISEDDNNDALNPFRVECGELAPGECAVRLSGGPASFHTCAVMADGTQRCWGNDDFGQLGDNQRLLVQSLPARTAANLDEFNISGLGTGPGMTCVIAGPDREVFCAGAGESNQFGSYRLASSQFIRIEGVSRAIALSSGNGHTCALTGTVTRPEALRCWGNDDFGQLGDTDPGNMPRTILGGDPDLPQPDDMAVGLEHTCALMTSGDIFCWGGNAQGQLGRLPNIEQEQECITPPCLRMPVRVNGIPEGSPVQISSRGRHTCALQAGQVWCWGDNSSEQCGAELVQDDPNVVGPTLVRNPDGNGPLQNIDKLAVGENHSCAVNTDGEAFCWGANYLGQLGAGFLDANMPSTALPFPVMSQWERVVDIAAGSSHTCVLAELDGGDHNVFCWGDNGRSQLGLGDGVGDDFVFAPLGLDASLTQGVTNADLSGMQLSAALNHACLLDHNQQVLCWGDNGFGQLGLGDALRQPMMVEVEGLANVRQATAGTSHTCAVQNDNTLLCWGKDEQGQTGVGATAIAPQAPPWGEDTIRVAAGQNHTCTLSGAGQVFCWGDNTRRQTGSASNNTQRLPNLVLIDAIEIHAGTNFNCAVLGTPEESTIHCWGDNSLGQLGRGQGCTQDTPCEPQAEPAPVEAFRGGAYRGLALGQDHACALSSTFDVRCWGDNSLGQRGLPDQESPFESNIVLGPNGQDLPPMAAVVAAATHTCALDVDGHVWCWGNNDEGQLHQAFGNTQTCGSSSCNPTPEQIPLLENIVTLSAGYNHTCALDAFGHVFCWGSNFFGQLAVTNTDPIDPNRPIAPAQ